MHFPVGTLFITALKCRHVKYFAQSYTASTLQHQVGFLSWVLFSFTCQISRYFNEYTEAYHMVSVFWEIIVKIRSLDSPHITGNLSNVYERMLTVCIAGILRPDRAPPPVCEGVFMQQVT